MALVADALPATGWVRGLGWRDADWTEPPNRAALDAIAPDAPVVLTSKDYHSLWLNSAALARAGGDLDAPGGVVERDAARRADRRPARERGMAVPRPPRHPVD